MNETISDLLRLIEAQAARISALEDVVDELKPAKMLPAIKSFSITDLNRIVKLRADLFHNPIAKQGTDKHKLKLFVWLDRKGAKQGHVQPLFFPMKLIPYLNIPAYDESLYARMGRQLQDGDMIGCLTHKSPGTVKQKDHVMARVDNKLLLSVNDWQVVMDEFEQPKAANKAPVGRWYWNRED